MKNTHRVEIRVRVPIWVVEILEREAAAVGITAKPRAVAAAQVIEDWAREQTQQEGAA